MPMPMPPPMQSAITLSEEKAWATFVRACAPVASATDVKQNDAINNIASENATTGRSNPGNSDVKAMNGAIAEK